MTTKAATASSIPIRRMMSAPPNVARRGTISMKSSRTTTTAMKATASANSASPRAQTARREMGSSAMRRRSMKVSGSRADALQCRPLGGGEERRGRLRPHGSVDRGKPVLRVRMVDEKLHPGMIGAVDAHENCAERARIAAQRGHQLAAERVRPPLDLAGIRGFQERLGRDDHRAAADEIAQHHAEQEI